MKRTQAYLIAEKLYFNAASNSFCNRNWLFTIYKSLLVSNANDKEEIKWTKYNQWKIDHNCRAAKAAAKKNGFKIDHLSLTIINDNKAAINNNLSAVVNFLNIFIPLILFVNILKYRSLIRCSLLFFLSFYFDQLYYSNSIYG